MTTWTSDHRGILILAAIVLFAASPAARAACTIPAGTEADIVYNTVTLQFQYCDGTDWIAMHPPGPSPGCENIGDICTDGTVYAGLSPDGNAPMYTTPADAGPFTWNNGDSGSLVDTAMVNCTDGPPGTATSCQTGEDNTSLLASLTDAHAPYDAAVYCNDLSAHGHADWYLPAQDELKVLWDNLVAIGGFNTAQGYWTSSEADMSMARYTTFNDGISGSSGKQWANLIRCIRKKSAGCTNPDAPEGSLSYNTAYRVLQGCAGNQWRAMGPPRTDGPPANVANEDFEGGASGWSPNITDNTEPANWTEFLGRFTGTGAQEVSKTFPLSGTQTQLEVAFDLYQIDNAMTFSVYLDDAEALRVPLPLGRPFTLQDPVFTRFLTYGYSYDGSQEAFKTFALSGTQALVTIEFDFYQIDSTADFTVYLDDAAILTHSYTPGGSVPAGSGSFAGGTWTATTEQTGGLAFGGGGAHDGKHHYTITYNTAATSLKFGFGKTHFEYGIDNLSITADTGGLPIANEDFELGASDWNDIATSGLRYAVYTSRYGGLGFGGGGAHDVDHHFTLVADTTAPTIKIGFGADSVTATYGIDNFTVHAVGAADACSGPEGPEGKLLFNDSLSVMQYCDGENWVAIGKAGGAPTDPCAGSPSPGDVCADGTYYIGQIAGQPIYAAAADEPGTYEWGGYNTDENGDNSAAAPELTDDGLANTDYLVDSSPNAHPAAQVCRDKGEGWYLPAQDELNLFWNNGSPVAGVDINGSFYWSSTEYTNWYSRMQRFSNGDLFGGFKHSSQLVRCVRR